jgi:hypothetical protein
MEMEQNGNDTGSGVARSTNTTVVPSALYTTEVESSRAAALDDLEAEEPDEQEAEAVLLKNEVPGRS